MKHLVEFPLESGGTIVVEVDDDLSGPARVSRGDTLVKAKETVEEAINKILPVTKGIIEKFKHMESKPDEIELSFGVKLNTSFGAVLASTSAEANFDITMRWTDQEKKTVTPNA